MKPARLRMGMARRYGISEAEMPTLRQVQWFISHYARKTLNRNDDHNGILDQIDQLAYGPQIPNKKFHLLLGGNATFVGSQMSVTTLMKNRSW
ncbi:hypothetical protein Pcac1_g9452 [Phytophthora cactorum]|nr:hypothetical protein Pcac1_g9452 [Phytophthora cactorum]